LSKIKLPSVSVSKKTPISAQCYKEVLYGGRRWVGDGQGDLMAIAELCSNHQIF
jgi:hypothetical protein